MKNEYEQGELFQEPNERIAKVENDVRELRGLIQRNFKAIFPMLNELCVASIATYKAVDEIKTNEPSSNKIYEPLEWVI